MADRTANSGVLGTRLGETRTFEDDATRSAFALSGLHPDGRRQERQKTTKRQLDQLRERRSEAELEALLAAALHSHRTTGKTF